MSWAWDFMLRTPDAVYGSKQEGLHVLHGSLSTQYQEADKNGDGYMEGSACRRNPKGRRPEIKKAHEERS